MKRLSRLFFIYAIFIMSSAARTVTNDNIGYSLTIPDNWIPFMTTATSTAFEDTSGTYKAVVGIYYENFSGDTLFTISREWTRAQFVSYELTINADPFCALAFFDTVSVKQNGVYWAPEVYSYNFESDTAVGDWAEYIRFTEVGKSGYELYAVGPLADLDSNIAHYANILDGFTLRGSNNPVIQPRHRRYSQQATVPLKFSSDRIDLLGRRFAGRPETQRAAQLIIEQRNKSCTFR